MRLGRNCLKKLSLGVTLIMSTSFIGCGATKNEQKDESSKIFKSLGTSEVYISPEGIVYETEEDYLRVANFDRTLEDLEQEASEKNLEIKELDYFPSYNLDAEINDIKFTSGYRTNGDEIYSYSVNSYDPYILQIFSDKKRVCVPHGNGIWTIKGVEVEDENGEIYLVYPDYELVEYDGKVYVAPIAATAKTNLQGIQDNIKGNKVKKN